MDRIMSTSINLFDQISNVNDVDIMVFEHSLLFPPSAVWGGGIDDMVRDFNFHVTQEKAGKLFCHEFGKFCFFCAVLILQKLKNTPK